MLIRYKNYFIFKFKFYSDTVLGYFKFFGQHTIFLKQLEVKLAIADIYIAKLINLKQHGKSPKQLTFRSFFDQP